MTAAAPSSSEVNVLLDKAARGSCVYLIAAGGCGMSGLGHLLLDLGFSVRGSDLLDNDEARQLRARGAVIHIGHRAEQIREARPILAVYSSAIRADNAEVREANAGGIPIIRRAVLLAALVARKRGICVAGMHGKTTTTSLLAFALDRLRADASFAVGALVPQLPAHARFAAGGSEGLFVAEADESDGTLRLFHPSHAIILNVDEEHLDYFENVQNICSEFEAFASHTTGAVIFCADDPRVTQLMARHPRGVSYGFHPLAQYRVELTGAQRFKVWHRGAEAGEFSIRLMGEKNISNACAAVALLLELGFAAPDIARAIADFSGAARRQQEIHRGDSIRVYDDYGHHPSEIRATLRLFKQMSPGRLVVVFQPHRYTRTFRLMSDFAQCFHDADRLVLTEVYAASEPEIPGANSAALAELLRSAGQGVDYVPHLVDVAPAVANMARPGDVILFLGAGDITRAAHQCADKLAKVALCLAPSVSRMKSSLFLEKLKSVLSSDTVVHPNEPLSKRTTIRVGGKADFYVEPGTEGDLAALLRACSEEAIPFTVIGRGSNLLVRDGGIRGVVIGLGHDSLAKVQVAGEHLHCGAGARLKAVCAEARKAGLAGLEFLEGIPGTIGGALRMNAGAMGSWMFEVVEQIRFMDFNGVIQERKASEVNVEYRGCPLFRTHIALGAVLKGQPAAKEVIQERARQFNSKRWESQPAQPSAGCIFKNPAAIPAGKLIDELGLKGTRRGGAMVSTVHGNFIVNEGNATARDVLELIDVIKETARTRRGIELETEVEILGE